MRMLNRFMLVFFLCLITFFSSFSQSIVVNNAFRLGSPYNEPDGRNDIVKINATDFVTLAKVKGNATGKSDFMLERYDGSSLQPQWQVSLSADGFEDYKDLYFNGKEIVLLSVIHNEGEKKTRLEGYGFDISSGTKTWTKEMEAYTVGDWETHAHKGKVKESFIDVVCEHANAEFVTPFEYKHNIHFSPDQSKFISYVFDYGQKNLTANISVYDNACNLLNRGIVTIDNDFTNHGIYINNKGTVFIINANNSGKLNFIQFDLVSKDFTLLELPPSNFQKDDFQVQFQNDDIIYVGNSEIAQGKVVGVMFSKFDFKNKKLEKSIYHEFRPEFKSEVVKERAAKGIKGDEDWKDYDITDFIVESNGNIVFLLEKRSLYAEGYPHVSRDMFDKSHTVEFIGHVHAEGILMLYFKDDLLEWSNYIAKNQVYPANDGLNSVSFVIDNTKAATIRLLYASSEGMDGMLSTLNIVSIDRATGNKTGPVILPNKDKLSLVKDYTIWPEDNSLIIVGKKGILGKSSNIAKYKL
ncbi:MAG TPA: hypothetical protein VNW99_10875 [Cytophagaceae bacterium]|jgi:hypothetical protein|nr:hypothetical protein [Cytophagaceae bacterium]